MLERFDCEQGSPEWVACRMGIPTASEFGTMLAKGEGKTRGAYMRKLAGEILTGEPMESYTNHHFERGKIMEDEARDYYALVTNTEPERVGFIRNGGTGCSPDSLLGADGTLEVKTALPHILIEKIETDRFPPEHKPQCQGVLMVAEREWVDLIVYWPRMPLFVKRAYRDEIYIAELGHAVARFNDELAALVDRIRRYGAPATLNADLAASVEIIDHDVMMQQAMRPR